MYDPALNHGRPYSPPISGPRQPSAPSIAHRAWIWEGPGQKGWIREDRPIMDIAARALSRPLADAPAQPRGSARRFPGRRTGQRCPTRSRRGTAAERSEAPIRNTQATTQRGAQTRHADSKSGEERADAAMQDVRVRALRTAQDTFWAVHDETGASPGPLLAPPRAAAVHWQRVGRARERGSRGAAGEEIWRTSPVR